MCYVLVSVAIAGVVAYNNHKLKKEATVNSDEDGNISNQERFHELQTKDGNEERLHDLQIKDGSMSNRETFHDMQIEERG